MGIGGTTGQNASSSRIQSYMSSVLQGLGFGPNKVGVTGAIGQQGASSYAGEGFVVGPKIEGTVYPLTLANTDNSATPNTNSAYWDGYNKTNNPPVLSNSKSDGFIKNCTLGACGTSSDSPDMFIDFHGLTIVSLKFDFQIFPDGTCASLSSCGSGNPPANLPDLELWWGDNATNGKNGLNVDPIMKWVGVVPNTSGTYKFSPNHSTGSGETAPQLLGISGLIKVSDYTSSNISTLDFMDWPETIGIDNLVVTLDPAPEPATIAIFALGLLGLAGIARRKRSRGADSADSPSTESCTS
jgi:hypothetical protein